MSRVSDILAKRLSGGRVTEAEGLALQTEGELFELGRAASELRRRQVPGDAVTYLVDRNINYTNVCVTDCKFCAFYRPPGDAEGYVLSREVLAAKMQETLDAGGTRILLQGGHNPALRIGWYEDLLGWMKRTFPALHLDAFSPSEVSHLAGLEGRTVRDVLKRLQDAGMDGMPGGGAEILHDEVRTEISPKKLSSDGWISAMRDAQALGLVTSATMVIGTGERPEHRVAHLMRVRELAFPSFVVWTMQAETSAMARVFAAKGILPASALDYLRQVAISRIVLDAIPHVGASWPTQGEKIAQAALAFGADDFGSTMLEENVVSAAGATRTRMDAGEIRRHIRAAGFVPAQRDSRYRTIRRFAQEAAA